MMLFFSSAIRSGRHGLAVTLDSAGPVKRRRRIGDDLPRMTPQLVSNTVLPCPTSAPQRRSIIKTPLASDHAEAG
jgi:hypothetical protein